MQISFGKFNIDLDAYDGTWASAIELHQAFVDPLTQRHANQALHFADLDRWSEVFANMIINLDVIMTHCKHYDALDADELLEMLYNWQGKIYGRQEIYTLVASYQMRLDRLAGCDTLSPQAAQTTIETQQPQIDTTLNNEYRLDLRRQFAQSLSRINQDNAELVKEYYGFNTTDEISYEMLAFADQLTRERIRQRLAKSLRQLHHPVRSCYYIDYRDCSFTWTPTINSWFAGRIDRMDNHLSQNWEHLSVRGQAQADKLKAEILAIFPARVKHQYEFLTNAQFGIGTALAFKRLPKHSQWVEEFTAHYRQWVQQAMQTDSNDCFYGWMSILLPMQQELGRVEQPELSY